MGYHNYPAVGFSLLDLSLRCFPPPGQNLKFESTQREEIRERRVIRQSMAFTSRVLAFTLIILPFFNVIVAGDSISLPCKNKDMPLLHIARFSCAGILRLRGGKEIRGPRGRGGGKGRPSATRVSDGSKYVFSCFYFSVRHVFFVFGQGHGVMVVYAAPGPLIDL